MMPHIDGKALSAELRSHFPEVPVTVIENIILENSSDRELCLEALNIECKKYQENLYGSVVGSSVDPPPLVTLRLDCAQGGDAGLDRSSSQTSSGRPSTDSQASDHSEVAASSLTPDRQNINPSHMIYALPQFPPSSLSSDPGRNSKSACTPPSNAPPYVIFNPPFVHPFSHQDQGFHGRGFPGLSGTPPRGDSAFGAYGNRPRTFDPHYSPFQGGSFRSPFVGGSMLAPQLVNFPGSGTRSPIPFASYPQPSNYYPSVSTSQQHFVGSTVDEQAINLLHLNQTNTRGSNISVLSMPFYTGNHQDVVLARPRSQSPYLHGGFSQENLTADVLTFSAGTPVFELPTSHTSQQPHYPGGSTSSGPSSMIGEELAYLQALVGFQKVRLDAFLTDLESQKKLLEQLRQEVGQQQQRSLNRRLSKSDIFPTAADRQKLLTENENLGMEIRLLTYELDLANNAQNMEDERFHDAISTGQFNQPVQLNHSANAQVPRPICTPQIGSPIGQPSFTNCRVPQPPKPTRPAPPPPYTSLPPSNLVPPDSDEGENWSCSACTFLNHPLLNKCECCEMPKLPATLSGTF